jgi:hypothetical protein
MLFCRGNCSAATVLRTFCTRTSRSCGAFQSGSTPLLLSPRGKMTMVVGASEVACNAIIQYWPCARSACEFQTELECSGNCEVCSDKSGTTQFIVDSSIFGGTNWAQVDMESVVEDSTACGLLSAGQPSCMWQDGTCVCSADRYYELVFCSAQKVTIYNTDCIPTDLPPPSPDPIDWDTPTPDPFGGDAP